MLDKADAAASRLRFHPVFLFWIRLDVNGSRLGPASADLVQSEENIRDNLDVLYA